MNQTEQRKFDSIPAKYRERVQEVEDDRADENGWWIHIKDGWNCCDPLGGLHTIHEDRWSDCLRYLRDSWPNPAEIKPA